MMDNKTPTLALRCYCCGEPITGTAVLAAYGQSGAVDRAFVLKPDHAEQVDDTLSTLFISIGPGGSR